MIIRIYKKLGEPSVTFFRAAAKLARDLREALAVGVEHTEFVEFVISPRTDVSLEGEIGARHRVGGRSNRHFQQRQ